MCDQGSGGGCGEDKKTMSSSHKSLEWTRRRLQFASHSITTGSLRWAQHCSNNLQPRNAKLFQTLFSSYNPSLMTAKDTH
jgi:hypothetical protein